MDHAKQSHVELASVEVLGPRHAHSYQAFQSRVHKFTELALGGNYFGEKLYFLKNFDGI